MLLLAVLILVVGVVSELLLREFLIDRFDAQLLAANDRSSIAQNEPPPHAENGPGPVFLQARGQGVGTLGAEVVNGRATAAAIIGTSGQPELIPTAEAAALAAVPVDGRVHNVDVGDQAYRVIATATPRGTNITGLPLSQVDDILWQLGVILAVVALVGLVAAGVAGAALVGAALRPLRRVAATASRVAELPLARGEVALAERVPDVDTNPHTEVGQVGAALNRMLGHIAGALAARHESETRVRRFVADASHELRTPLAAIRGYAELTRRGRDDLPDDVAFAMGRVESESKRMTALVEDLLLLARLDAGRQVVHEPVDLARLLADAVADAHAAGPDHRWLLRLPDEPLTALGDPNQLHQVVANLLTNARTHTPAGTTVTAALAAHGPHAAEVTVTDDGPGIPPRLLPEVFERFARGDSSRSRAAGSTGLGLSIVAAVVAAHHGTVQVRSRPGQTVFTVVLPLHPGEPGAPRPGGGLTRGRG